MLGSDRILEAQERLSESERRLRGNRVDPQTEIMSSREIREFLMYGLTMAGNLTLELISEIAAYAANKLSIYKPIKFQGFARKTFDQWLILMGSIFPRKLREEVFLPAKEDLRQNLIEGNHRYRQGWQRRLFLASIAWEAFLLFAGTAFEGTKRPFGKLVPEVVKGIWRMFT